VRGVALRDITPHAVQLFARAAARTLGAQSVVIGYDTRESSEQLALAVAHGFHCEGVEVFIAGVAPTPAIAFLAEHCDAIGAVITASHNPFTDNGLKFFGLGGGKLNDDQEAVIQGVYESLIDEGAELLNGPDVFAHVGLDAYVAHVCASAVDLPSSLSIVVDCAHGAMSRIAPQILARLGIDATVVNNDPDGRNINANCGAAHSAALVAAVKTSGANMGIAFDGDGDRLIAVDQDGNVVDGDHLIAIAALDMKAHGKLTDNTVVVTVMTNIGFHRAMFTANIDVVTTPVGDRCVLAALQSSGAALGGEQSGHIVYRHFAATGDGLLAATQLFGALGRSRMSLAELARQSMTSMPQVLVNVVLPSGCAAAEIIENCANEIRSIEIELGDNGRVLVRPSGTEPLIRVMVEATTHAEATRFASRLAHVVSPSATT